MALLQKLNFNCGEQNKQFEDVPVPTIEEGAEIRIRKLNIKGQLRMSRLHKSIEEMGETDNDLIALYRNTATLMCVMVDEQGKELVPGEDVVGTFEFLEAKGVFFSLVTANNRVNGLKIDEGQDLEHSKKNS